MDDADVAIRNVTYHQFVAFGRAPTAAETASDCGLTGDDIVAVWRRLHVQHALVLDRSTDELRMLNPFSAVPTAHRVYADERWWYANCAWDAFGICAALGADGLVETSCPDCAEPLPVRVVEQRPSDDSLLFHCLVPASQWWDNIAFT